MNFIFTPFMNLRVALFYKYVTDPAKINQVGTNYTAS